MKTPEDVRVEAHTYADRCLEDSGHLFPMDRTQLLREMLALAFIDGCAAMAKINADELRAITEGATDDHQS